MIRVLTALLLVVLPILGLGSPVMGMEIDGSDPRDPSLVYLELRPDLDETRIRGNAGIPSDFQVGIFNMYSLPVWNAGVNANEELYFLVCVPDRWDGEHDILVHVTSALLNANEQGHTYQLDMNWEKVTPNIEVVPVAFHSVSAQRYNLSNLQYYCYRDYFVLDYDAPANDPILADDVLALRIRLGSVGGQYVDLDGELLILEVSVLFPRGDLIGEEADMAEAYFLLCFIVLAIGLMIACYAFKKPVLGFAAAGGWLFLGIYSYTLATDGKGIYWSLFFFCMGLMIVSIFEAMGKRGKVERGEDYETDADLKETREQLNALETESKIAREPTSRLRKIIRGNKKKRRPKY